MTYYLFNTAINKGITTDQIRDNAKYWILNNNLDYIEIIIPV
jgi:hypothetical protein